MNNMEQRKRKAKLENDLYRDETNDLQELHFSLPIPPSINHMYVRTRRGGNILNKNAKLYVAQARAKINEAVEDQRWLMPSYATWLYIDLVFFMPDRRVRDSHNLLKLMLDVMEGVIFINDCFVMPRIQSVELDTENPRVEIRVITQTRKARERALNMSS